MTPKTFLLILSLLTFSCCPIKKGPPGDSEDINWVAPTEVPEETVHDCKGGEIDRLTIRESGYVLHNCVVRGGVRITGLARNGEDKSIRDESHKEGYVSYVRSKAPSHVRIEHCVLIAEGGIPLYLSPGVTFAKIQDTVIQGVSSSVMVYLDAETRGNTIERSVIDASQADREAIAIDASSHNTIQGNRIIHKKGGVYLYRNCGEGGTTRHTTPSYNVIRDNSIEGNGIAVWVGSREGNRCYCDKDSGWPFGSSQSDLDHARYNIVLDNMVVGGRIID